jgi:ABC-type transporter Mla subunit MlaD
MTENTAQGASAPDVTDRHRQLDQTKEDLRTALTGALCVQHLIKTNVANYYNGNHPDINEGLAAVQTVLLSVLEQRFGMLSDQIDCFLEGR